MVSSPPEPKTPGGTGLTMNRPERSERVPWRPAKPPQLIRDEVSLRTPSRVCSAAAVVCSPAGLTMKSTLSMRSPATPSGMTDPATVSRSTPEMPRPSMMSSASTQIRPSSGISSGSRSKTATLFLRWPPPFSSTHWRNRPWERIWMSRGRPLTASAGCSGSPSCQPRTEPASTDSDTVTRSRRPAAATLKPASPERSNRPTICTPRCIWSATCSAASWPLMIPIGASAGTASRSKSVPVPAVSKSLMTRSSKPSGPW
jgi:hypothetical protein